MSTKRQILSHLTWNEIRAAAKHYELSFAGHPSKDQLTATLAAARRVSIAEVLEPLPIDRLKRICAEQGIDAGGRVKAALVARLTQASPTETSRRESQVRKAKQTSNAPSTPAANVSPKAESSSEPSPKTGITTEVRLASDPVIDTGLRIPNRFESLQEVFGQDVRPLIVPVESDLRALNRLADRARIQNGGLLVFLLGDTGVGKTTAAHSATVHMPSIFAPILRIPPELSFREVQGWLNHHLPPPSRDKTQILLFDGRELSDDEVGLKQLLSSLNQILRRRSDLLFCWPATDHEWYEHVHSIATKIGGENFAPREAAHQVAGPPKAKWPSVLDQVLRQFGKTCEDVGIGLDLIDQITHSEQRIGDFLTKIGVSIAERVTKTREAKQLPQIVFVISSSADIIGETNRIRRAGTQMLAPEPLLGYSPRSEAGKWWTERNRDPNHHLGYIISLFDARLVTMTASAVIYACLHHGNDILTKAAATKGARADRGNAKRTIEVSELYRFLRGERSPEFTTGRKGGLRESTGEAYGAIQRLSSKHHKAINYALCSLTKEHLSEMEFTPKDLEVAQGQNIFTDAIVRYNGRPFSLEFHHVSEANCSAANMASYMMDKLRNYAWHHQLIPR